MSEPFYYEMLYEALVGRKKGYNLQESRVVGKLLDKFEKCGKVSETVGGIDLYTMTEPCTIEIEDAEFSMLEAVFNDMNWIAAGTRKAVQVADWLAEVKKGG